LSLCALTVPASGAPTPDADPGRLPIARPPHAAHLCQPAGCGKAFAALLAEANGVPRDTGLLGPVRDLSDTDLLHNDLEIELIVSGDQLTLDGSNTMTVRSLIDGLDRFDLRLRSNFAITAAAVDGVPATVQAVDTVTRTVLFPSSFDAGEAFDLTIAYNGVAVSRGFGSIEVAQAGGQPVVASLSEPYYAYTWWPCKDGAWGEPGDNADKATLELALIAPASMRSVANGLLEGTDALPGGRTRYRWRSEYPTATYLVAFGSHPYNTWTETFTYDDGQTLHQMPVEFNIYPSSDTSFNRAAWNQSVDMLAVFSDRFGLYPFIDEKYGIYQFPFGGGMEHQTNSGQSGFGASLTAHELAHQWFGDMITCRTWSDIWLNEGFATYSEALWQEFQPGSAGHASLIDAMNARRPAEWATSSQAVYVTETDDLGRIFSYNTTYLKAAWVVHMLRGVMGDEMFFGQFLPEYRTRFAYKAATTEDFRLVAEEVSGLDLEAFFQQWVYGVGTPAYDAGWENASIDGRDYIRLFLEQDQSPGFPTFEMPVQVALDAQPVTVLNNARDQHYLIPVDAPVSSVTVDPSTWILRDPVGSRAYTDGPPKIVRTTPMPGETVGTLAAIEIVFSDPVDAQPGDFALTGPAGAVALSLDQPEPNRVVLTPAANGAGAHSLTVGEGVTFAGRALDGEIATAIDPFPSGDGLPGGAAAIGFLVAPAGSEPEYEPTALVLRAAL
jgi:aminopeptidase N